jgi:hypothetical protein
MKYCTNSIVITANTIKKFIFILDRCRRDYSIIYNHSDSATIWSIVSAHLNDDDRPDIIVSFIGSNPPDSNLGTVRILFNNGNGTFTVQTIFDSDILVPVAVAVIDVNGNDKRDIIIMLNGYSKEIHVFLDSDINTLTAVRKSFFNGSVLFFMTVADLNNDTKPDIVVANIFSGYMNILFNTDNGTFNDQMNYDTGCQQFVVATADLNNNGTVDIIVACISEQKIIIFHNDNNGRFITNSTIYTVHVLAHMVVIDVNDDDKPDIILTNYDPFIVTVYLNIGDGKFADPTIYEVHGRPVSVAAKDMNNDKKIDIVVGQTNAIDILFNTGNGTFIRQPTYPINTGADLMVINDMNADNYLDIILGSMDNIGIYYMHCD